MTAMKADMRIALATLESLLESDPITKGMTVRAHGESRILGRPDDSGPDDRVKLTRIGRAAWGLSVKRHTGRWERTPFSGKLDEMVEVMHSLMQHLVAS